MKPLIRYRLSNAQRKELLVRGGLIVIALPLHPSEIDWADAADPSELAEFAAASIEGATLDQVRRVAIVDLIVGASSGEGLTGCLGAIFGEPSPSNLQRLCPALVVDLCATAKPRHQSQRPQWPASALIGEYEYPRRDGAKGGAT
jgi:hypothetical protein